MKPFIFTKCGMVWNEKGEIRRTLLEIRRECEDSLRRLQVEAIDLYQIHWPVEDQDIEEGWSTMADLKHEGKVRNIGVSNFTVAQMERAGDRPDRLTPAALLADQSRGRNRDSALLPRSHDRRHQLLA